MDIGQCVVIIKRLIDNRKHITDPHEWSDKEKLKKRFLGEADYIPMLEERIEVLKEAHDALGQINFDISSLFCDHVNSTLRRSSYFVSIAKVCTVTFNFKRLV